MGLRMTAASAQPAIEVHGLYQHVHGLPMLQNIELSVPENGWVLLHGQNGVGKTLLCRILMALDQPSAGSVSVAGQSYETLTLATLAQLRTKLGVVLQQSGLISQLSVLDNLLLPLRNQPISRQQMAREARLIMTLLQLDGLEDQFPDELSLGQRRLVELGRALIIKPPVLIWDGIADGLGETVTRSMLSVLHEIRQNRGLTFLATDNNLHALQGFDHRIAVLAAGQILFHGTAEELKQAAQPPNELAFYLGTSR